MNVFEFGLFTLGLILTIWSTIYAIIEYHNERLTEFDEAVKQVAHFEVREQYIRHHQGPDWAGKTSRTLFVSVGSPHSITSRLEPLLETGRVLPVSR